MVSILFSYSHRDQEHRDELETHLAVLKREGTINAWHDRRIDAGAEVHDEISEHLEQANVILLLVSAYFWILTTATREKWPARLNVKRAHLYVSPEGFTPKWCAKTVLKTIEKQRNL